MKSNTTITKEWQKRVQDYQSKLGEEMSLAPTLHAVQEEGVRVLQDVRSQGLVAQTMTAVESLLSKLADSQGLARWQTALRSGATAKLEQCTMDLCSVVYECCQKASPENDLRASGRGLKLLRTMTLAMAALTFPEVVGEASASTFSPAIPEKSVDVRSV